MKSIPPWMAVVLSLLQFKSILDFLNSETPHKVNCVCLLLTLSVHLMPTFSLKKYHEVIRKVFIHNQYWTKSGIDHLDNVWHKHFRHFMLGKCIDIQQFWEI